MRRREFLLSIAALAGPPLGVHAEGAGRRPLIVYLAGGKNPGYFEPFRAGLRELGYVEGRDIDIVTRFAEGRPERIPALAEEAVGLKPNVILAGAVDTAVAARKLTLVIPIVVPALADAVHLGLIANDARPGGNVTGIAP